MTINILSNNQVNISFNIVIAAVIVVFISVVLAIKNYIFV